MNKKNNGRSSGNLGSILIRAAAVLFILTVFSIHLLGGLLARYVSNGQDVDSARVAGFDVKVNGPQDVVCNVTALKSGDVMLQVENDSEVAVSYSIRIVIDEKAGCGVRVTLDNTKDLKFPAGEKSEQTYSSVGYLGVNADPVSHTLSFTAIDWTKITQTVANKESATLEQPFTIYVDVVQVD